MLTNKKYSGRMPLVVVAALLSLMIMLPLAGCKNDTVPEPTNQEQTGDSSGGVGTDQEPTQYTVTFNANGGSTVASQTVESGQPATKPDDPTKDGWMFLGWYEDSGLTKEFDFSTPVTADITLYAKWRANPGTVVSDGLTIGEIKLEKTSEVQVLSEAVDLSSLYKDGVDSDVFISGRSGTIQPFVMGQYEVTQQLYREVMGQWGGTEPSDTYGVGDEYPAYYVSWYDAVVFCNRLSQLTGLEPVYSKGGETDTSEWGEVPTSSDAGWDAITCDFTKSGYRLPTEAEWELAARGGNAGADAWKYTYAGSSSIDEVAWYVTNSGNEAGKEKKTHQVGTKAANSLNLYDMSGNLWELCWDWHGSIAADTPSVGAASGSERVCRGGGWFNPASSCTVSYHDGGDPSNRDSDGRGFRLVRSAN